MTVAEHDHDPALRAGAGRGLLACSPEIGSWLSRASLSQASPTESTASSRASFNQHSKLGAYLDPMADKLLLVSVFVVLGFLANCRCGW